MSKIPNPNSPAAYVPGEEGIEIDLGLSKREYFMAAALTGLLASNNGNIFTPMGLVDTKKVFKLTDEIVDEFMLD